jgi:deoxyribodipyrimidine photo-lyase
MARSRLLWHRRDLRIHDNELYQTDAQKKIIYSLFIFDPPDHSPRPTGISDDDGGGEDQLLNVLHGPHFTRRLLDAVHSLRRNLQSLGGNLIVRRGDPLHVIPQLAQKLNVEEVAWSEIPGYYECTHSEKLKNVLLRDGLYRCKVYTTCSLTLFHPDDLPKEQYTWERLARPKEKRKKRQSKPKSSADIEPTEDGVNDNELSSTITNISPSRFIGMPIIMGDVRRAARSSASIRDLYEDPQPSCIAKDFSGLDDTGDIPPLDELSQPLLQSNASLLGFLPKELIRQLVQSAKDMSISQSQNDDDVEEKAMTHLQSFVQNHAASANRSLCDVSDNDSSKLSVPLALGVLSPQQVHHCVKRQQKRLESQDGSSLHNTVNPDDLNWITSHMEMRDFFIFDTFRHGINLYRRVPSRPAHKPTEHREWLPLLEHKDSFFRWACGQTGLPLVDAGMKELVSTGYISNRIRQNLASVLTKDLKLDWRAGAEFYQLCLEDHCVAANFGNWAYFSGVGGDPKSRHFRTISQAWRYDSDGRYVRKWIGRLKDCDVKDVEIVLRPWAFLNDWHSPIVPPETQLTWQDREKLEATGRISSK